MVLTRSQSKKQTGSVYFSDVREYLLKMINEIKTSKSSNERKNLFLKFYIEMQRDEKKRAFIYHPSHKKFLKAMYDKANEIKDHYTPKEQAILFKPFTQMF